MGDSAGGNLALAALLKAKDLNLPLPTAVAAISPATDFTCGSPSLVSRASLDPIINPMALPALIPVYLGSDTDPSHPYASPLFGDYQGMPFLLLQVGDAEVLLDDSRRLAKHAAQQACDVTFEVWEGMPHVFQGFAPYLPEASEAIARIGQFLRAHRGRHAGADCGAAMRGRPVFPASASSRAGEPGDRRRGIMPRA